LNATFPPSQQRGPQTSHATPVIWNRRPLARTEEHPRSTVTALYQGRLYTIVNGGILSCLDASAGKLLYRERINAPGPYFSAPVAAAGRIYIASSEGR
jgi:hypothetical protein